MQQAFLPYWLATFYLRNIQPRKFLRWLSHFADIKHLFDASKEELLAVGLTVDQIHDVKHPAWHLVERDIQWAQQSQRQFITHDSADYPTLLRNIPDAPLLLSVMGNHAVLSLPQISMVGARKATPSGLKTADHFARALVQSGIAVTSGLALGIDGASHRGALAANGVTIAVAGTGLQHIYPSSHRSLAAEIVEKGGAIVSEFVLDAPPRALNFPRRNRVISGLCMGVLVIEAAIKSGSLITAKYALEQGREVFAVPGSIFNPLSRGCHALIRQGAKLVEAVADIIDELSAFHAIYNEEAIVSSPRDMPADLPPESRELLDQIDYAVTPFDVIVLRTRLTAREVSAILLSLELQGCIESVPGGYVKMVTTRKVDKRHYV